MVMRRLFRFVLVLADLTHFSPAQAQVQIKSVVNAASFQEGVPSGGALATVFCTGLSGTPDLYTAANSSPLPFKLAGVQVTINGAAAPLLAVYIAGTGQDSMSQINFQVPLERHSTFEVYSGLDNGSMVISSGATNGILSSFSGLGGPGNGGFFADANGYAIAQHAADNTLVTPDNPAHAGETIVAYGDDFFTVWPPPPIAIPAPSQPLSSRDFTVPKAIGWSTLYLQAYPVDLPCAGALLCGSRATTPPVSVLFAGLAPGLVGVQQINFIVPSTQAPGDWALFFNAGSGGVAGGVAEQAAISSPYAMLPVRLAVPKQGELV